MKTLKVKSEDKGEKKHTLKFDPCYTPCSGGLFTCEDCGKSYCSPPWEKEKAQKDHLQNRAKSEDNWEERFERLFIIPTSETRYDGRPSPIIYKIDGTPEEMTDFIRQEIKEAEERGRRNLLDECPDTQFLNGKAKSKLIEDVKKRLPEPAECDFGCTNLKTGYVNGQNGYRQEVLDILNNLS